MKDFKNFIFKNIGFFLVFVLSALYIIKGIYEIDKTGRGVIETLGAGAISMTVGFAINIIFRKSGIIYAEDDCEVISANNLHKKTVDEISSKIDVLDSFCLEENKKVLKEMRTRILSVAGLKYDECFDKDGLALSPDFIFDFEKRENKKEDKKLRKLAKNKYRSYKKAVNLKITLLTPSSLTTDSQKSSDPFDFGISKGKYQRKKSGFDLISRLFLGILFGYFTLHKSDSFSYEDILWNALQIAIFLVFGVIQMLESYMFVKNEGVSSTLKKVDILQKFKIYISNQ